MMTAAESMSRQTTETESMSRQTTETDTGIGPNQLLELWKQQASKASMVLSQGATSTALDNISSSK
jgi:hypothetical protein